MILGGMGTSFLIAGAADSALLPNVSLHNNELPLSFGFSVDKGYYPAYCIYLAAMTLTLYDK